jgi:hypothetical protein
MATGLCAIFKFCIFKINAKFIMIIFKFERVEISVISLRDVTLVLEFTLSDVFLTESCFLFLQSVWGLPLRCFKSNFVFLCFCVFCDVL